MMTWSCLGFKFALVACLDILGVKFDSRLTFEDHVRCMVSSVFQTLVFWCWWSVSLWTPLRCFVLFCFWVIFWTVVAVQRPNRRLHLRRLFFYPLTGTELGSKPSLTTHDRELVSVLEEWKRTKFFFIQIKSIWYYNVYIESSPGKLESSPGISTRDLWLCSLSLYQLYHGLVDRTSTTMHLFFQSFEYCFPVWGSSSASRAPGVFCGLALRWSDFRVIVSSTSCCCTVYVVQGQFELESLFVLWAFICFCQS